MTADFLDRLGLTSPQRAAAVERSHDLTVTAGAGSGKTRTLVARYLGLLADGWEPRRIATITFTEKAAREMRFRIRAEIQKQVRQENSALERQHWLDLDGQMDSARISTIHSLCTEILRAHPVEAGLDPNFGVIEQNLAIALRVQAVAETVDWAVGRPENRRVFDALSAIGLGSLLSRLLENRLDVGVQVFDLTAARVEVAGRLAAFLQDDQVSGILAEFRAARAGRTLAVDAGEGLVDQIVRLLEGIDAAEEALAQSDPPAAALALFQARRAGMKLSGGKKGRIKEALKELQTCYDTWLDPWLGGKTASVAPPDPAVEQILVEIAPLIQACNTQALGAYRRLLDEKRDLDFDDLEAGAARLLELPRVRARWQAEIGAVLVDEFQDTNARQRAIVQALAGETPGRLFVVGDARQSIYRFRGADVTVFTGLQAQIERRGGQTFVFDATFRAHPGLLEATAALLGGVMGTEADPARPYSIPFSGLVSKRPGPRENVSSPFIECILGQGEDSESGRVSAARALARRLLELRASQEIGAWEEVALLCRASTSFPPYEEALEEAGIPFVTVAGSGFYDRPEVRDLINQLRAIADPWDDQAMAGMLRSPACGLSDAGIYRLRIAQGQPRPLYQALQADLDCLEEMDRIRATRALEIIADLVPLADRLPVAELLRRLVSRLDYRAVLAGERSRLWLNVDKLINDAQTSGLVQVGAFFEYLATLRDAGARESEAGSEAEGAVRLMTIHRAKGLEFPIVVLADANRQPNRGRECAVRLGTAWSVSLDRLESAPLAFRLARWLDGDQADAEDKRLLYVALTRAQEKLIISGFLGGKPASPRVNGWLSELLDAGGILPGALFERAGEWQPKLLLNNQPWAIWLEPAGAAIPIKSISTGAAWPETGELGLTRPLNGRAYTVKIGHSLFHGFSEPLTPPAKVVGEMVHRAIRHWRFTEDAGLARLLAATAREKGLVRPELVERAVTEASRLLARFRRDPLWSELNQAQQRYHEVPYSVCMENGAVDSGVIDCIYRTPGGWRILDFRTDELHSPTAVQAVIAKNQEQLERYRAAFRAMIGEDPGLSMVFLNVKQRVQAVKV